MHQVFLSLGSNVGDRNENLRNANFFLNQGTNRILRFSSVYETEPWGNKDQQNFFNQVVEIGTELPAVELLAFLKGIESHMGRTVSEIRYEPRVIDIDILFYEQLILTSETLMIPHPLIHQRRFVLIPLVEIAENWIHPVLGHTMKELLDRCDDSLEVKVANSLQ